MPEWWTYRLGDFLMFTPRTYYRLFELYNRGVWPLHVATLAAGVAILYLLRKNAGRAIALTLSALWLWIAWAFHLQRYATILWAAKWFAAAFALQALLLLWTGVVRNRLQPRRPIPRVGLAIFLFALFLQPPIGPLLGRPWQQMEIFGIAPDPTIAATLGALLILGERPRITLLIIPLLWTAIAGATLWTMEARDALLLPVIGVLTLVLAWRYSRPTGYNRARSS